MKSAVADILNSALHPRVPDVRADSISVRRPSSDVLRKHFDLEWRYVQNLHFGSSVHSSLHRDQDLTLPMERISLALPNSCFNQFLAFGTFGGQILC